MKKLTISTLAIVLLFGNVNAQAPDGFSYQAVIRNASGEVMADQAVGIQISLLQGTASGTVVYQETFSGTSNSFGLVNLNVGSGTIVLGTFSSINWGAGPYFIEMALDVSGGTSYVVMGTSQLMSVPYALYAQSSATDGADGSDGKSAYQIWLDAGNTGSEDDFLASLVGSGGTQDISLTGTELSITDGSTVDLSVIDTDTDTQLSEAEVDAFVANNGYLASEVDGDLTNELQDISTDNTAGNLSLSDGSTITLNVNDADADATNELQDISGIATNAGDIVTIQGEQTTQNTAIALNTAKVGYTDALVSANTDVVANTAKVGYTEAAVTANTSVAANTAKVGVTNGTIPGQMQYWNGPCAF